MKIIIPQCKVERLVRGGSFNRDFSWARNVSRASGSNHYRNRLLGFRLIMMEIR